MTPGPPQMINGKLRTEATKSWKKINEERKALKKQRKQEKILKELESNAAKAETLSSSDAAAEADKPGKSTPRPNPSTVSIAVPGSILENAQSAELRTYVAGQIARAACIFRVSEVIVFDDVGVSTARETKRNYEADEATTGGHDDGQTSATVRSSSLQLARILQYLECPQYLRKFFFPLHKDLQYSGLLNPLDAPHHLRQQNVFPYREGIISDKKKAKEGYSYANVGLLNDVLVDKAIEPGVRVTVKLGKTSDQTKKLRGSVVSPDEPRRETGVYWGYTVRIAHSISEIFTKSPYQGGYDLTLGTSDRGSDVNSVPAKSLAFDHLLVVFGGLKGLEEALANDDRLNVDDPALLFDHYVNVLPKQGSRTIRTEEAILISLAALQEKFNVKVPDVESDLSSGLPRSEDTGMSLNAGQFNRKQKKPKFSRLMDEPNPTDEPQVTHEEPVVAEKMKNHRNKFRETAAQECPDRAVAVVSASSQEIPPKRKRPDREERNDNDDFEVVPVLPSNSSDTGVEHTKIEDVDLSRFD